MARAALVGVPIAYALLAILSRVTVWASPTTVIGGGGGDSPQTAWFLSWVPYALSHHVDPFVSHAMNAPAGVNLLWNTSVPAAAVLLWPITAATNAVMTFNVVATASLALSAWFAFLALRRYLRTWWAAALGGLLFGFSPLMSAQEGAHLQVVASALTVPLTAILLDDVLIRQRLRWWLAGLLMALLLVLQFFIFEEYFATMIIAAALLFAVLAVVRRHDVRAHAAHAARVLTLAALVVTALLAYPVWAIQLHGPDAVAATASFHDPDVFSTNALNFFMPTPIEWLSPGPLEFITSKFSDNPSEADAYLGVPLLIVAFTVLVRQWRDPVVRVAGIFGVAIAICSVGPHLHVGHNTHIPMPWWLAAHLPLLGNILPSRLAMFMYLPVAILFARGLELLAERRAWRALRWLQPAAVAVVVFVFIAPKVPYPSQPMSIPPFFASQAAQRIPQGSTAFTIPMPSANHVEAMNGQVLNQFRFALIGGYFLGPVAPGQTALQRAAAALQQSAQLTPSLQMTMLDELRASKVRVVMVMPVSNQRAIAAYLTTIFGSPAADQGGVVVWVLRP